ncbi:TonB-dependent siderophore receptor [cf. Phormidesmis sp. LEGE 11477]|uniref:TonB-dependent siderophore receptor n=1 Tax=cf. Phormidesmis sp. LEGE 11477 TaxID=1828680 RepID=UPI001882458D|nr:TonB-dependent siderophore receptor [cf. Phormidesmis sp. LEGE 11477]MBE9064914.1 TonB-dependent siderophore receptor [cf. Phormidesmis sp. LEGE 11477]
MKSLLELITLRVWNGWDSLSTSLLLVPLLLVAMPAAAVYAQIDAAQDETQSEVQPSTLLDQLRGDLEVEPSAEITGIRLVEIEDGLKVVLITDQPELVEVFQFQEGTTLTVDITNATLSLADTEDGFIAADGSYQQLNPIAGVASLRVEQRGSEIQLTVISDSETPPVAYFERLSEALQLDVVTLIPGATDTEIDFESNNLRIIVTAEPLDGFRVQEATTGTRTNTALIDVPQSIQVIPEAVIEEQGSTSLADTLRNVSGVNAGRSSPGLQATTPLIRGFESNNILRNGLRDDTLRIGAGINNIERIEILKGPASVLFGSGSLSGTINLVTEEPLTEPRYEFGASAGSFELYGGEFDWTGPLDEAGQLGYRLNLAYQERGSFRDFEESDLFFVAPSFQLANTERSSLIVDVEYFSRRSYGTATGLPPVPAIGFEGNTIAENALAQGLEEPNNPNRVTLDSPGIQRAGTLDLRTNPSNPDLSYTETNIARLGYRFEYDFNDNWKFRNEFLGSFQDTPQDSVVGINGREQVGGQPDFQLYSRAYLNNISSREALTLNSNIVGEYELLGIDQTLLLGAEFSKEDSTDVLLVRLGRGRAPDVPNLPPFNIYDPVYRDDEFFFDTSSDPVLFRGDTVTRRQTLGFYGQLQLDFSDYLILLVGGRFDVADQFFQDDEPRFQDPSARDPISTYDTAFSPRIGVVLKPVENVSVYASYVESFLPVIGRNAGGDIFVPERGKQFETGIKANLFDDRLNMTLAYYDLRRSGVVTEDSNDIGVLVQVGEQKSSGIEFDLIGEPLPGWNIIANYAYTDALVSQDNDFEVGTRLQNAPRNSANLWTSYEIQGGALEGLGIGTGISFVSDRNGDLREPFVIPAYTRTDAAVFYRRNGFNAQLNFQNLFNVRYFEGARDQNRVLPGEPFSVIGTVSWEF